MNKYGFLLNLWDWIQVLPTCVWLQLSLLFMKIGSQMAHETAGRVLTADLSTQLLPGMESVLQRSTAASQKKRRKTFFSPTASTLSTSIKSDRQSHIPGYGWMTVKCLQMPCLLGYGLSAVADMGHTERRTS